MAEKTKGEEKAAAEEAKAEALEALREAQEAQVYELGPLKAAGDGYGDGRSDLLIGTCGSDLFTSSAGAAYRLLAD